MGIINVALWLGPGAVGPASLLGSNAATSVAVAIAIVVVARSGMEAAIVVEPTALGTELGNVVHFTAIVATIIAPKATAITTTTKAAASTIVTTTAWVEVAVVVALIGRVATTAVTLHITT